MAKLRIHCPYRYKECLELGCPRDKYSLKERRILANSPYEFCHRACGFWSEKMDKVYNQ